MFDDVENNPRLIDLYFLHKDRSTDVGKIMQQFETRYINQVDAPLLSKIFNLSLEEAKLSSQLLIAFRMGVAHQWAHEPKKNIKMRKEKIRKINEWVQKVMMNSLP